jgi:uncharacterized protein (TIGR03083 family)
MTTDSLTRNTTDTPSISAAAQIAPISHVEAGTLAQTEISRFLALLETLKPADWGQSTMCTGWSVRDIVAHQAGAYQAMTSFKAFRRMWSRKPAPGKDLLDTVNAVQIAERAERTPEQLIAELRDVAPTALANRRNLWPIVRMLPIVPVPPLGLRRVGYLTDELFLRDTWSHRVDISTAVGKPLDLTPEHDGRITALIVRDLNQRLRKQLAGRSVVYELVGPAGGSYRVGDATTPAATISLDCIDFHLLASGRVSADALQPRCRITGDTDVASRALADTYNNVVY